MKKNRKLENTKIDGLTSDWLFKKPIDFEYKKYILLNYIKNSENTIVMILSPRICTPRGDFVKILINDIVGWCGAYHIGEKICF